MRLRTSTTRRGGVTLIEVLVALFVVAIGLLALLTLFPLGALSMAQAVKDDRTAHEAYNMNSIARAYWKVALEYNASLPAPPQNLESVIDQAMVNPGGVLPDLSKQIPAYSGPSYPVYVDYWGYKTFPPPWRNWLAGQQNLMPRARLNAPLAPVTSPPPPALPPLSGTNPWFEPNIAVSLFSGLDDLTFDPAGTPGGQTGSPPEREGRYSAALVYRRGDWTEPRFVDVTVVVFRGRSLQFTPQLVPAGEVPYTTGPNPNGPPNPQQGFVQGSNVVELVYAGARPTLRAGDWVMDAQMVDPPNSANPSPHGYFYRVVNLTDVNGSTIELELQTPARASTTAGSPIVVLDNVAEVFDKPTMAPQ